MASPHLFWIDAVSASHPVEDWFRLCLDFAANRKKAIEEWLPALMDHIREKRPGWTPPPNWTDDQPAEPPPTRRAERRRYCREERKGKPHHYLPALQIDLWEDDRLSSSAQKFFQRLIGHARGRREFPTYIKSWATICRRHTQSIRRWARALVECGWLDGWWWDPTTRQGTCRISAKGMALLTIPPPKHPIMLSDVAPPRPNRPWYYTRRAREAAAKTTGQSLPDRSGQRKRAHSSS